MKSLVRFAVIILISLQFVLVKKADSKTFIIGIEDLNSPPLQWIENGELKGVYRELLDSFAQHKEYTFIYETLPVGGLFNALISGEVDFKVPDDPKWMGSLKRDKKLVYSHALVDFTEGVMVKPSNLSKELKVISSDNGVDNKHLFDLGTVTMFNTFTLEAAIRMVLKSRTDGVYTNVFAAQYYLKKHYNKTNSLVFDPSLPHHTGSYYMSTANHPQVIEEFNNYLVQQRELVDKIKAKYQILKMD